VSLHQGFFWYYFLPNKRPLEVYEQKGSPCNYIHPRKGANRYLFKVYYTKHRIAVEFFHVLTDGTGGLIFLKSLVAEYLRLSGETVGEDPQIFLADGKVDAREKEDSFERFYKPLKSVFKSESGSFHLKRGSLTDGVQVLSGQLKVEELKAISQKYGATITEYLVSELIWALQQLQDLKVKKAAKRRPIRVSVPVNIRRLYDSVTMRNFSLFVVIGIDPSLGFWSFEEIVEQVIHQLRGGVNAKALSKQVARNVAGRRNFLIRYAPNALKKPLMKLLSDSYGDRIYSTTFSNLGNVSLPEGMADIIKRLDFYLSPSKTNKVSCSAIGSGNTISLNFTSIFAKRTDFERIVFSSLVDKGVGVKLETNRK
jgi:NRPS condensation-like uncharacterized protein